MDTLIIIFALLIAIAAFLGMVLMIVLYVFDPKRRRQRLLREQARIDYANARGTAHLRMLLNVYEKLKSQAQESSKQVEESNRRLAKIQQEQTKDLHEVIEARIVRDHIHEIPGIGPKLSAQLVSNVYRSRLSDLRKAEIYIHGIGDSRQYQINAWVCSWENQVPKLVEDEFPGKQEILDRYAENISQASAEIKRLEKQKSKAMAKYDKATELIHSLQEVSTRDFERVLLGQQNQNDSKIRFYLTGIFPEWEPMPEWFKEIVSEN